MSEAADAAVVRVMLADYANGDASGKLNVIGAGITMIGFDPNINVTIPHAVIAHVAFPPKFVGESPAIELALENDDGTLVTLPTPGGSQFLRVGAANPLKPAIAPGAHVPSGAVRPSVQFVMFFASGLPLPPNRGYVWRVKVDHHTRDDWTEKFYVLTASPGPVLG